MGGVGGVSEEVYANGVFDFGWGVIESGSGRVYGYFQFRGECVKVCLRCGGEPKASLQVGMWMCLGCGFSWWQECNLYLKEDYWPMEYSVGTGNLLIEVPKGCLAVFGDGL